MLLVLLLSLLWSWFVVRWYIGDTLAEYLNPEVNTIEMARRAVSLAPSDPLTHWRLGEFIQKQLPPENLPQAIAEYEKAVSLAPNDYRLWMSLGIAIEQSGDSERAETALRRAVALAPSYSYPAWYLGNLLLRSGRYQEAFAELRRASESNDELRSQLFNLAWEVYSSDLESLKNAIGDTVEIRLHFSRYLLDRGRFEDGLRVWQSLGESEQHKHRETGREIVTKLLEAKRFHDALIVWNGLQKAREHPAETGTDRVLSETGKILDGGFEAGLAHGLESVFGWQVKSMPQVQVGIDPNHAKSGRRSLRLRFQVQSKLDAISISQLVVVDPGVEYDFECFSRTEKLESISTPLIQIVDATDGSVLASTPEAASGSSEWQNLSLKFKSGEKTQAIIVRVARNPCAGNDVCPIYGIVWYDDFTLKRSS